MFRLELGRYLKSKASLIIIILVMIGIGDFAFTYIQKCEFIEMYETSTDEDLDMERLKDLIDRDTGIKFVIDYISGPDFSSLEVIALLAWTGIFLSSVMLDYKSSGFGNFIVTRMDYKRYAITQLAVQSVYILIVIMIETILQILAACIIGGFKVDVVYIEAWRTNLFGALVVILLQKLIVWLYVSVFNAITLMLDIVVHNRYFLQACPLVVFCVIPMLLAGSVANIWEAFADIIIYFEVDCVISSVTNAIMNPDMIAGYVSVVLVYITIMVLLIRNNIRVNEKDYV